MTNAGLLGWWSNPFRPQLADTPDHCRINDGCRTVAAHSRYRALHWGRYVARRARRGTGESVRVLCGEFAESFGDRVNGRLAGGDVDHEFVDVVVAGA